MESAFTIENERFENNSKRKSLAITIGFHAVILLIFAFFAGVTSPVPPFEGGGVEVNFGISDVGSGDMQPLSDAPNIEAPIVKAVSPLVKVKDNPDDKIITQTTEDAPEVITNNKTVEKSKPLIKPIDDKPIIDKPETKPSTEPIKKVIERTVDNRAIYHGPKGKTNYSRGDGDNGVPGDKGKRNGNPTAKGYTGNSGHSTGGPGGNDAGPIKFSLTGRKMLQVPIIEDKSQEAGTVAIRITVDDKGNVVQAGYTQTGSTTNNSVLVKKALVAAKAAKFNPSDVIEQKGVMYIRFTLQ